MKCLHCHRNIPRLRAWTTRSEFCSDEHAAQYKSQTLDRLITEQRGGSPIVAPLPIENERHENEFPLKAGEEQVEADAGDLAALDGDSDQDIDELWRLADEINDADSSALEEALSYGSPTSRPPEEQTADDALEALRALAGRRSSNADDSDDDLAAAALDDRSDDQDAESSIEFGSVFETMDADFSSALDLDLLADIERHMVSDEPGDSPADQDDPGREAAQAPQDDYEEFSASMLADRLMEAGAGAEPDSRVRDWADNQAESGAADPPSAPLDMVDLEPPEPDFASLANESPAEGRIGLEAGLEAGLAPSAAAGRKTMRFRPVFALEPLEPRAHAILGELDGDDSARLEIATERIDVLQPAVQQPLSADLAADAATPKPLVARLRRTPSGVWMTDGFRNIEAPAQEQSAEPPALVSTQPLAPGGLFIERIGAAARQSPNGQDQADCSVDAPQESVGEVQ